MATIGIWGIASPKGSGTGRALASHFKSSGHTVVGIGRREPSDWSSVSSGRFVEVDFKDGIPSKEDFASRCGELDCLIITAGVVGVVDYIWNADVSKAQSMMDANLWTPIWATHLAAHVTHHIIFTGSIAGIKPMEGCSIYTATKMGMVGFVQSIRKELLEHHVSMINFDNIDKVGPKKVLAAYDFLVNVPGSHDLTMEVSRGPSS